MIVNIILVAFGGAFGSVFRYLISQIISEQIKGQSFPISTILVNILGSFLAGILHFIFINNVNYLNSEARLIFMIGFLGAFTTFSTFSLDVFRLFNAGQYLVALSYIILSVILSILAIFLGFYLSSLISN